MRATRLVKSLLMGFALISSGAALHAATLTVTNTNDDGPGSLRDAVASAASGDTVDFALSGCPCVIPLTTGEIVIAKTLTIAGPGAADLTISGEGVSRILYVPSGHEVRISGLTLTNGAASDAGGAILNVGTLYVDDCAISGNTAVSALDTKGGGIYNGRYLFVGNSSITANIAYDGGGIYNDAYLYVTNTTISGNTSYYGHGGGVYFSTFARYTDSKLYSSTISGNFGQSQGGAGIYSHVPDYPSHIELRNTIVAGNFGHPGFPDIFGYFDSRGYNLIGVGYYDSLNFTLPTDQKGTISAPLDPLLGPLQDNGGATPTQALLPGSPAVDKGGYAWDPVTFSRLTQDQRGLPRPVDDSAVPNAVDSRGEDIGAFELGCDCDTTPPVIVPHVSGTLGDGGWYVSDVQLSWSVVDDESDVSVTNLCDTQVFSADMNETSIGCSATSAGGTSFHGVTIKRDATPPTLAPSVSPNPASLDGAATATPNASDALSGIASQTCADADTSAIGDFTVKCTATDNAGNSASASASYQVVLSYGFVGFYQPVDNLPTLNLVTAGSSIPVKFSLTGDQGMDIFATGFPASSPIACDASEPGDVIEETVAAGGSSLSYSAGADQYNYVWKTDKAWQGTCRMLVVGLRDGSRHLAKFKFR